MRRSLMAGLMVAFAVLGRAVPAAAHCEVPCGIYDDERRFEEMLEDCDTVAKAMTNIRELTAQLRQEADPLAANQLARWVAVKESHATNTQHIIAQYFMTQRIKPDAEGYVKKLTAAHAVLIAAMKCKQNVDGAQADALRAAILDFYRAYEGKEPQLGHDH